jgi:peptidoglycan/LPS O-acetylase OafA/YrhL
MVLMQSLERTDVTGWRMFAHFYIKRVFRIYPLSISMVVLCLVLTLQPGLQGEPFIWGGIGGVAANLLLVQNITGNAEVLIPLWTLPFEVQMYLALPFIYLGLKAWRNPVLPFVLYGIAVFLGRSAGLLRFVPCFMAGVIAYRLSSVVRPRIWGWLWFPAVLGMASLYMMSPYSFRATKDMFFCLMVGLAIPMFRDVQGLLVEPAAQVAKYSYGIYLTHTPIIWLFYRQLEMPDWLRLIGVVIAVGAASMLCYHIIENPLIKVGARLAEKAARRSASYRL